MKQVVATRDDIVFYIKMFPLTSIHPEAYAKSAAVLCEKDNDKALKLLEDAFANITIPAPKCETSAVDESIRMGRSLGVSSTPTIVFGNGRIVSGAIKANELAERATEK